MSNFTNVAKIHDITVVRFVFNEINLEQREILKTELAELVPSGGTKYIIDLSKVGFLSSLVIAVIVFFSKEIHEKNGGVKLSGLSSEALSIFQLTHLDRVFELYETEHDALESFKKIS